MTVSDADVVNQDALTTAVHRLSVKLTRLVGEAVAEPGDAAAAVVTAPALLALQEAFGLTPFERDVLLLAAACEFSAEVHDLCARLNGGRRGPTFGLCMTALDDAHWDAMTPARPLRRWQLVELDDPRSVSQSTLRVAERVLHYLAGIDYLEPRIAAMRLRPAGPTAVAPSQQRVADELTARLRRGDAEPIAVHLAGDDRGARLTIAAEIAGRLELSLLAIDAAEVEARAADVDALCRLLERECALSAALPAICCATGEPSSVVGRVIDGLATPLVLLADEPPRHVRRTLVRGAVDKPGDDEQEALWRQALGPAAATLNGTLRVVSGQYRLGAVDIALAGAQIAERVAEGDEAAAAVTATCRAMSRTRLGDLADRVETRAGWDDLVIADAPREVLKQIVAQVRTRQRVYGDWGFGRRASRGLGISALFVGESGTGKTLAAEVIAAELGLDLYRIDLSGVVSKYIGETEKNLSRVFASAEDSGAVLLFDEADALFGKRSEVKDSHDRYANVEVSYLLQRMDAYRGLAVLTTNQRAALDQAFERRLRFIVTFAFPDTRQREAIWRHVFPAAVPLDGVDFTRLAQLHVTGGVIRNIALNAAFLAADADEPVRMTHLAQAARAEIGKTERPTGDAQIRSWT